MEHIQFSVGVRSAWILLLLVCGPFTVTAREKVVEPPLHLWAEKRFVEPASLDRLREGILIEASRLAVARNMRPDGGYRMLNGEEVHSGLFMDAPARLRILLVRPAKAFNATVGIDENRDVLMNAEKSSVRFTIEAAGKPITKSEIIGVAGNGVEINAEFPPVKELVLSVDDGGDGFGWDQALWANPTVTYDDGTTADLSIFPFAHHRSDLLGLPFSAHIDNQPIKDIIQEWTYSSEQENHHDWNLLRHSYLHPSGNLELEFEVKLFNHHSAVDILCKVSNPGALISPLISDLMPIDTSLVQSPSRPVLRWSEGDKNHATAFMPHDHELTRETSKTLTPQGGRSSNGTLPFFNLHDGKSDGWIVAVGWTGQWTTSFDNILDTLRFKAGMEKTNFRLQPGEIVRAPRIALLQYSGPMENGHTSFRRLMIDNYIARINDEPASPPIAHNVAATVWSSMKPAAEANQFPVIEKAAELGVEAYWMDAYYFPQFWYENVGNWFARPDDFPGGMRALSEKVHQEGMKFVLWFEPERVYEGTELDKQIPDFLVRLPGSKDRLVKLHKPAARQYLTDFIAKKIQEWGVDLYRQDFNIDPLPYWRSQDSDERQGITEMYYVQGLYDFWDELRRRFPGLTIDNTASGGRRIDLETMSRSFPLWRSDFNDIGEGLKGESYWPRMGMADQIHSAGLSLYFPFHSGPLWSMEPYNVRSAMTSNLVLYDAIIREDFPDETAKQAIDEVKSLRLFLLGDYYVLLPFSQDQGDWFAWQYHRPKEGDGFAVFFRRPDSVYTQAMIPLRGVQADQNYSVTWSYDFTEQPEQLLTGEELATLNVNLEQAPGSALLRYRLAEKK